MADDTPAERDESLDIAEGHPVRVRTPFWVSWQLLWPANQEEVMGVPSRKCRQPMSQEIIAEIASQSRNIAYPECFRSRGNELWRSSSDVGDR